MSEELKNNVISPEAITRFKHFCSGELVLREIHESFQDAGVDYNKNLDTSRESSQRRAEAAKYLVTLDFSSTSDVDKFLRVLTSLITIKDYSEDRATQPPSLRALLSLLYKDGFVFDFNSHSFTRLAAQSGAVKTVNVPVEKTLIAPTALGRDLFICHVTEDKAELVDALVDALVAAEVTVWYDKFGLVWGRSLRKLIEDGLRTSKYGLVIISPNFLEAGDNPERWAPKEMDALHITDRMLPIWYKVSKKDVEAKMPLIATLKAEPMGSPSDIPLIVTKVKEFLAKK